MQLELDLLGQLLALALRGNRNAILVEVAFAVKLIVVLRVLRVRCILKELNNLLSGQIISNTAYLTL